jgi:hypothetical protein
VGGLAGGGAPDGRVDAVILWARAIVPGLCVAAAALPLLRFGLPEHAHARILEALASRRG